MILLLEVKNPVSSYTSIALLKIESQRDLPNIFPPPFLYFTFAKKAKEKAKYKNLEKLQF